MKALLYILAAVLLLAGCSPCKHIAAIQVQRQDSTHTEVVTKTYFVTDIYIDFDRKKVDEANRRVLDWVLYGKRQ